jgi:hypothetical protein
MALAGLLGGSHAHAQAIGSIEVRPFVTGLIPVIGRNGAVGGIAVDADGVVARSTTAQARELKAARAAALAPAISPVAVSSRLRKISLQGLQAALRTQISRAGRYDDELQNLAGLTRIEYVFVDADYRDLVLAGPAEGWRVDEQGNVVSLKTGTAPVQLDDLIVALRTARAAASGRGISCSIDPTSDGLSRLKPLLKSRSLNENIIAKMEAALGPQQITITGVPASSHFARVLVAADFGMKRLGKGFEVSPASGLTSYLELLKTPGAPRPENAMPRWWMAPSYNPLERDEAGLAWRLSGPGVQTLSEAGYLRSAGGERRERDDALPRQWAADMTERYAQLSRAMPVFAELRNCMDLAVVAALLVKEELPGRAGCNLDLLLDERQVAVAEYAVPRQVDSRASLVRKGASWLLSLSGGVQVDSWSVLQRVENSREVAEQRTPALASRREHWWWD